jgi:hypothetical protein
MQASFSDLEYASKRKLTRRDQFLAQLEAVTPWSTLVAAIAPFYPKGRVRGARRSTWNGCCGWSWRSSASDCRMMALGCAV